MAIRQISVFVPNQNGALERLVNVLAEAQVDMRAMAIADTADFGILRMIVKGHDKACAVLREAGYLVSQNDVTAVEIPDQPGGLARVVSILADHGVNIEYTYAFMTPSHGHACVVFRVEDNDLVDNILAQNDIVCLKHSGSDETPW
ncbi:MAG: ACT domain-containing protein [Ruminococcaceae bacterium]|nr:ACT domain-containing protein [Oscillospiraceae bacterium]